MPLGITYCVGKQTVVLSHQCEDKVIPVHREIQPEADHNGLPGNQEECGVPAGHRLQHHLSQASQQCGTASRP